MSLLPDDVVLDIIRSHGPVTTKQISEYAAQKNIPLEKEYINSILYGYLREVVVRDRNQYNVPVWRLKTQKFEAAKGYEAKLSTELLKHKIVQPENILLDLQIQNRRLKKTYHLDIAIFHNDKKFNIEVDGFDHMRADARLSIQNQIKRHGQDCEIDIDWMDNKTSFVDFGSIDSALVSRWCSKHLSWCIAYHEELLWPHDITRNIWLIENGWKIMRLWNAQVTTTMNQTIKEITEWISK